MANIIVKFNQAENTTSFQKLPEVIFGPFFNEALARSFIKADIKHFAAKNLLDADENTVYWAESNTWKLSGIGRWTIMKLADPMNRTPGVHVNNW